MKIITDSKKLNKEFERLLENYNNYYWTSAWAGYNFPVFEKLKKNLNKIQKIIIGIHFYQTHPEFIKTFIKNKNIKYIKQPAGTYHPKLYLFHNNDNEWEVIIGSPNFTKPAFSDNTEASILIKSNDNDSEAILKSIQKLIQKCWASSEFFNEKELNKYKIIWQNHKSKIKSLSGMYGNEQKKSKPIYEVSISNMTWDDYVKKIKSEKHHSLQKRIKVIEIAQVLFNKVESFYELNEDERKFIAGLKNHLNVDKDVDSGYFGSMKGTGIFANKIITNDLNISAALDEIPKTGQIAKSHYKGFEKYFQKVFDKQLLAPATRLLAMKRPDVFVCLDSKNKANLCKDFGIVQRGLNYERYWDEIIMRIYDSEWWVNFKHSNDIDLKISNARAAFLDSLYYEK